LFVVKLRKLEYEN